MRRTSILGRSVSERLRRWASEGPRPSADENSVLFPARVIFRLKGSDSNE